MVWKRKSKTNNAYRCKRSRIRKLNDKGDECQKIENEEKCKRVGRSTQQNDHSDECNKSEIIEQKCDIDKPCKRIRISTKQNDKIDKCNKFEIPDLCSNLSREDALIQCLKYLLVKLYLIGIGPFFIVPFGYLKIVLFLKNHDEKNLSSKEEQ